MKAIILSAGQGRRLLPHTAERPKCLVALRGCSVMEWQLRALAEARIEEVRIVVGFGAGQVEQQLQQCRLANMHVETILNPIYDRADNLSSCQVASHEMDGDFLLINGDTLFEPEVIHRLLASPAAPVSMAIVHKPTYDADDMKVARENGFVVRVGKDLPADCVDGEAIGLSLYRGEGPALFRAAVDDVGSRPDSMRQWYLAAVSLLAQRQLVQGVDMYGMTWAEIDYPKDLPLADRVAHFLEQHLSTPRRAGATAAHENGGEAAADHGALAYGSGLAAALR